MEPSRSRSRSPGRSAASNRPRTRDWPTSWEQPNPAAASSSSVADALPYDGGEEQYGRQQTEPTSYDDRWSGGGESWRREDRQAPESARAWSAHDPRWRAAGLPSHEAYDQQQQQQQQRYGGQSWEVRRSTDHHAATYPQPNQTHYEQRPSDDWYGGRRPGPADSGRGWRDDGPQAAYDQSNLPPVPWQGEQGGSHERDDQGADGRWPHDRHDSYELPASRQTTSSGYDAQATYDDAAGRSHERRPESIPVSSGEPPSHPPPYQRPPSEPSKHVIFLGLDPDMEETDLFNFLAVSGSEVESTTIIRDKATGLSKGFGFALFKSLEDSACFIDASHPQVLLPFGNAPPRRVKVDYSSTTGAPSTRPTSAWSGPSGLAGEANDGMRDIATGASGGGRILLLRGVDGKTRWSDVLHKLEEVEATSGTVRRVVGLVGKEQGGSSWGFGFVELRSIEAARALLAHIMSATAHPQGFTFPPSSKPVSVTFASALSFVPHVPAPSTDSSEAAQTIPAGGPGGLGDLPSDVSVRYWDEQALLRCQWATGWQEGDQRELETAALARSATKKSSRHAGTPAMALATSKEPADPAAEAKGMLRRLEKDAMMPIAIKFGGGGKPAKADKAASSVFGARADDSDDEGGEGAKSTLPVKGKLYKVPPMAASRKVATSISKWNTTQKELADVSDSQAGPSNSGHGGFQPSAANTVLAHHHQPRAFQTKTAETPAAVAVPPPQVAPAAVPATTPSAAKDDAADEFEFSDVKKTACLLCQRQLKSLDLLRKHNVASDLHKRNLLDAPLRQLAAERVAVATAAQASEYRDRAAERRVAFNQPDKVSGHASSSSAGFPQPKRKFVEGPAPEPVAPPPEPVLAPAEDADNVGNKLLAKMGWTQGQGLGLQGEGRVDPVETQLRAARAGLGAASRPAAAPQGGASGVNRGGSYAQGAMDSARERY